MTRLAASSSVLATVLFAVACSKQASRPRELVLAPFSTAIDYAPYYVAKEFRWFEAEPTLAGIRIVYGEPFAGLDQISAAFEARRLHALFSAEPPAIITRASGHDVRIVGLSCTLKQEILVRADLPVTSPAGLRGRNIAVLEGTSSYYGLLNVLKSAGLPPEAVRIEFMGPSDAKAAFEARKIDAWAVWPPFVEEQQLAGRGRVLPGGDAVIQSVMTVPTDLLVSHPDVVAAFVRVLTRAKQYLIANPVESQRLVSAAAGIDSLVVRAAWSKHNWAAALDSGVVADIQNKADFLAQQRATRENYRVNVMTELIDARKN